MTWRYVLTKVDSGIPDEDLWEIREVYFGEGDQISYTEGAIAASGNTVDEVRRALEQMLGDLDRPWLDLTGDEPRLVQED